MTATHERTSRTSRTGSVLTSPAANTLLAVIGLCVPVIAWAANNALIKDALLVVETIIVAGLAGYLFWLRRAYIQLRRANAKKMSDARYFEAVRAELEADLISDFDEIADGHLHLYATEVPRTSVMLYKVLLETNCEPRRVLATDLTTDPKVLGKRREYLAMNRRFIEAGGVIQRVFICRLNDLVRRSFATELIELVSHHRSMGVQCGLAVREWLPPEQAVDFVVFGLAAVLIEEEQGDEVYEVGRSTVSFRFAPRWAGRFDAVWNGAGTHSAPTRLRRYETTVRGMVDRSSWRPSNVRTSLEFRPDDQ